MLRNLIFPMLLLWVQSAISQPVVPEPACGSPGAAQFDFWVGDWELHWNDTSAGTNSIRKVLGGCGIEENFISPADQFKGMSWSVYDRKTSSWQQTWIDNQGGYILLTGKFENQVMTLTTKPVQNKEGKMMIYRMRYYNIRQDDLDWNWESSVDDGRTWQVNWKIHYRRKK